MTIWKEARLHASRGCLIGVLTTAAALTAPVAACANNYGESGAWQFKTSADRATQVAVLDLIARRRGGYDAAVITRRRSTTRPSRGR